MENENVENQMKVDGIEEEECKKANLRLNKSKSELNQAKKI